MSEPLSSNLRLIERMADRFLAWPLPQSVCSDLCTTDSSYKFPRSGTNLLNAYEAREMLVHASVPAFEEIARLSEGWALCRSVYRREVAELARLRSALDRFLPLTRAVNPDSQDAYWHARKAVERPASETTGEQK